ncbi:MAG: DUF2066 domain-containing protein [Alphaproteobacteria bacterium]|nr:DUF2066 domain-containing protein [Alphaproteobacteria bacterium]
MVDLRLCIAAVLLLATATPAARGQTSTGATESLFTVRDIAVDETAQSASQARERALYVGQRAAFTRLINRLTVPADRTRLGQIDDTTIQRLVRDIEISAERTSAVRYLAKLSVRFNPAGVRQRLAAAGVSMVETPSPAVVVLPIYGAADQAVLWQDPNPWRDAWNAAPPASGLVPLILPVGDVADMGDISAEQAIGGDAERLRALAQRYGAGDVVVVRAELARGGQDDGERRLNVMVTRPDAPDTPVFAEHFTVADEAELPAAMAQAIERIEAALDDKWKQEFLVNLGESQRMIVAVPIESLADWLEVRRRLSGISALRRSTLITLSQNEAVLDLGFVGNAQQLRTALAQRQLQLGGSQDAWELRLLRGTGGAPAPAVREPPQKQQPDEEE